MYFAVAVTAEEGMLKVHDADVLPSHDVEGEVDQLLNVYPDAAVWDNVMEVPDM